MPNKETSRIAVLMGGLSTERDISLKSGAAVSSALKSMGWFVIEIDVNTDLPSQLRTHKITHAWLALHGKFGEDGCVQGLLEIMQIPYTGSGVRACAISMDKFQSKQILRGGKIQMAKDQLVHSIEEGLDFPVPCVVKDPIGGSSIGVWMCKTEEEKQSALTDCFLNSSNALIEEWVIGEEITVAVLEGKALPVVLIRPKNDFFDLEAKYTKGKTDYLVPAPIAKDLAQNAQIQAVEAYNRIGMQGIARADFLITENQGPIFLEINAIPGMTQTSLSPMAANSAGISFEELVESVLMNAHLEGPHKAE